MRSYRAFGLKTFSLKVALIAFTATLPQFLQAESVAQSPEPVNSDLQQADSSVTHFELVHKTGLLSPDGLLKKGALLQHIQQRLSLLSSRVTSSPDTDGNESEQPTKKRRGHAKRSLKTSRGHGYPSQLNTRGAAASNKGALTIPKDSAFWSSTIKVGKVDLEAIIDTASGLLLVDGTKYTTKLAGKDIKKRFEIDFFDGSSSAGNVSRQMR